jgi:hypothetical protein
MAKIPSSVELLELSQPLLGNDEHKEDSNTSSSYASTNLPNQARMPFRRVLGIVKTTLSGYLTSEDIARLSSTAKEFKMESLKFRGPESSVPLPVETVLNEIPAPLFSENSSNLSSPAVEAGVGLDGEREALAQAGSGDSSEPDLSLSLLHSTIPVYLSPLTNNDQRVRFALRQELIRKNILAENGVMTAEQEKNNLISFLISHPNFAYVAMGSKECLEQIPHRHKNQSALNAYEQENYKSRGLVRKRIDGALGFAGGLVLSSLLFAAHLAYAALTLGVLPISLLALMVPFVLSSLLPSRLSVPLSQLMGNIAKSLIIKWVRSFYGVFVEFGVVTPMLKMIGSGALLINRNTFKHGIHSFGDAVTALAKYFNQKFLGRDHFFKFLAKDIFDEVGPGQRDIERDLPDRQSVNRYIDQKIESRKTVIGAAQYHRNTTPFLKGTLERLTPEPMSAQALESPVAA